MNPLHLRDVAVLAGGTAVLPAALGALLVDIVLAARDDGQPCGAIPEADGDATPYGAAVARSPSATATRTPAACGCVRERVSGTSLPFPLDIRTA